MTNNTKIFLVLNSGSSSEKFSLYEGEDEVCSLYFEGVEDGGKKKFICTITRADGSEEQIDKAAAEWDADAMFSPIAMTLDSNGRPNGTKQFVTTHADSFKAGVKWILEQLIAL